MFVAPKMVHFGWHPSVIDACRNQASHQSMLPTCRRQRLSFPVLQSTFVNKAGWLLKRGKLQRKWVKRWFSVNSHKGSFRYCNYPGSVRAIPLDGFSLRSSGLRQSNGLMAIKSSDISPKTH